MNFEGKVIRKKALSQILSAKFAIPSIMFEIRDILR